MRSPLVGAFTIATVPSLWEPLRGTEVSLHPHHLPVNLHRSILAVPLFPPAFLVKC
ncbi:hypothetical protein [Brunnivagina elsteri]|uniref:hypothetical protein n=1 Tax=Brunnivagina elsteri TaxID=1247191 RepID=UPI0013045091|nr:hypothetical protein [Calothrix elsteri]